MFLDDVWRLVSRARETGALRPLVEAVRSLAEEVQGAERDRRRTTEDLERRIAALEASRLTGQRREP